MEEKVYIHSNKKIKMPGSNLLEKFEALLRDKKENLNQFNFLMGRYNIKLSFHYRNRIDFYLIDLIIL